MLVSRLHCGGGLMAQLSQAVGACSSSLFSYPSRTQLPSSRPWLSLTACKPSLIRCSSSSASGNPLSCPSLYSTYNIKPSLQIQFADDKDKPSVGFLGLGIMGTAMATNLIKAGYNVSVWNRNASKCEPLVDQGASFGASPAEIASQCNITFAMLADPAAAVVCFAFDVG